MKTFKEGICYVYFVRCQAEDNPVKIGVSKNPWKRIIDLQVSNPFKLKIICAVKMPNENQAYGVEKRLHEIFYDRQLRGEWFDESCISDAIRLCKKYSKQNYRWEEEIIPQTLDWQHLETIRGIHF